MNNVARALVKKKVLILGSKEIDTINNLDVYDTYNDDLYLSEKNLKRSYFKAYSQSMVYRWGWVQKYQMGQR